MSYRTLKRILGETNFEVKCLVLFGVGLSALAVITFWLYWWQTSSLIDDQNQTTARLMMAPMIQQKHYEWVGGLRDKLEGSDGDQATPEDDEPVNKPPMLEDNGLKYLIKQVSETASELQPVRLREFEFELVDANPSGARASDRPTDSIGYQALQVLKDALAARQSSPPPEDGELSEPYYIHIDAEKNEYRYYAPVIASKSCLECHRRHSHPLPDGRVRVLEGDLIGMCRITLPLQTVESALHSANAFVITAEFVKVVLAILAIYLVVRYVITKPVLHLKKVSDAIAHGNLDMRADIRTGDEFEELSHAFNRMLRHLVTIQDELREVNADLDAKVDELANVNLQLYEMNNIKNEFLATMSHELRTPLNSILGFSEVLSVAPNLNEKQLKYVTNIQTSGRSLMTLINDVLDLAKIESGRMEMHPAEFQISDLVEQQISVMTATAERRRIALSFVVEDGIPVLFQDAGKIQQVLNNLLSNAIKFTPEGGRVRLTAARNQDQCVLIVEDNGIGIPLDEQERIFEKFRQGRTVPGQEDALTRRYEGTGLGLSIVKEITRLLGGEISLQSEFGKGSVFTITFPLVLKDLGSVDEEATSRLVGLNRFRTVDLPGRSTDHAGAATRRPASSNAADIQSPSARTTGSKHSSRNSVGAKDVQATSGTPHGLRIADEDDSPDGASESS